MINIDFLLLGLSGAGSYFAKELARFLGTCRDERISSTLYVLDPDDVTELDAENGAYLYNDIGWNRAGVMQGVLSAAYTDLNIVAYANMLNENGIEAFLSKQIGYGNHRELLVVYDFSDKGLCKKGIKMFDQRFASVLMIRPTKTDVEIISKMADIGDLVRNVKQRTKLTKTCGLERMLEISHICMAIATQMYDNNLMLSDIPYMVPADKQYARQFCQKDDAWLVVCVGTGGTGGNFCKEFPHLMLEKKNISLLMIDGDRVEGKNVKRQPYGKRDIMQNKAQILMKDLAADYPMLQERLFSWPHYLDTVEDLYNAIASVNASYDHVLLIGGVDNHAARRVMQQYHLGKDNSVYVDSANEWSTGEVVVAVRANGIDQSPVRSFYFPNVLTDTSPSASEISCGAINESAPQHQVTNLTAARIIFSSVVPVLLKGMVYCGITYFDAFKYFARFQPVNREMLREAAHG